MVSKMEVLKAKLVELLNDTNYKISTFYEPINSGEAVDRWTENMQTLTDEANDEGYTAWGILMQTNSGSITYLGTNVAYNFDFNLNVVTHIDNKDSVSSKFNEIVETFTKAKQTITIDDVTYSIQVGFSNPNYEMPDIENNNEELTLELSGECCVAPLGQVLTSLDLISNVTINGIQVPVVDTTSQYSANNDGNVQTEATGYYTNSFTYRCGIQGSYTIVCDLSNSICVELFELTKKRTTTPNKTYTFVETITTPNKTYTYNQKCFITQVGIDVADNGIVYLDVKVNNNG